MTSLVSLSLPLFILYLEWAYLAYGVGINRKVMTGKHKIEINELPLSRLLFSYSSCITATAIPFLSPFSILH